MRFLALQTDIGALKKQFIAEGEEEILTTSQHTISFIIHMVWTVLLAFVISTFLASAFMALNGGATGFLAPFVVLGVLIVAYETVRGYIEWRFNFLVVTTEKVVIIRHHSFLYQHVNPIHLENIASTRFDSQFFGILRCGSVHICLKERKEGSTREVTVSYVPKPDVVASAIENAIVLEKQRSTHVEPPAEQLKRVQGVHQKIEESVKQEPIAPTMQSAENPVQPQ